MHPLLQPFSIHLGHVPVEGLEGIFVRALPLGIVREAMRLMAEHPNDNCVAHAMLVVAAACDANCESLIRPEDVEHINAGVIDKIAVAALTVSGALKPAREREEALKKN